MTKRQTPPGRISKLDVVVVKPFGPHHCARCLGSVNAEKTSSRGASNSRMPMIDRGSLERSRLFVAPTRRILFRLLGGVGLKSLQVVVEPIEALVVKSAVVRQPIVDVLERAWLDAARAPLRLAGARNEAGTFQHLEVLRHRRKAHGKGLGEFRDRGLAKRQARQDGAAGRVGKG